jgi:hypothetical protein
MNKFNGPGDANYSLVKGVIRKLADDAADVIDRRKTGKLIVKRCMSYSNNNKASNTGIL